MSETRTTADRTTADRPAADRPATDDHTADDQAAADRTTADRTVDDHPADDRTVDDRTTPDRTTADRPAAPLVSAREARERVAAGAVLLDTRSPGGRERTGAIEGAVIVDRDRLDEEFDLDGAGRHQEVGSLDTPIVVVCGSVGGSGPVAEALIARGFVNVVHVEGGAPAWHESAS
jgi:rhodanese-related sulfurtransferase